MKKAWLVFTCLLLCMMTTIPVCARAGGGGSSGSGGGGGSYDGSHTAVNITAKTMVTVLAVYFISPSYCYLLAEAILFIAVKYSRKADRAKSC